MRALHLSKTGIGGTWAVQQVRGLVALGVDVHVAVPPGPQVARYREVGAVVHVCHPGLVPTRPHTWAAAIGTVDRLVTALRPDLLHSHFVDTTLAMRRAPSARQVPRIFQVPGPLHLEHRVTRAIEQAGTDDRDHWIGSCTWVRDAYLAGGVPAERVHLSRYGVDLEAHRAPRAIDLHEALDLPPGRRVVGMVAYAYPPKRYLGQTRGIKGHEDLIDAVALGVAGGMDLHLVLVGGPWGGADGYFEQIQRRAAAALPQRHTFLGTRDDVAALYPGFDVAVHPSLSENLGGAGESLLAGVPTIATRVGGFPDLVETGVTGWLCDPASPAALASTLAEALSDRERARRIGAAGQERARQLLDLTLTSAEVRAIYDLVLDGQPSGSTPLG